MIVPHPNGVTYMQLKHIQTPLNFTVVISLKRLHDIHMYVICPYSRNLGIETSKQKS